MKIRGARLAAAMATLALGISTNVAAANASMTLMAPAPAFHYTAQQIVNRMDASMAHPARYTGLFTSPPGIGRLARVTNCQTHEATPGNAISNCDLTGVPVGTTANLGIIVAENKVASVNVSVQNDIKADSGMSALAGELAEGALIATVDPQAQERGIGAKTHEQLIMEGLSPGPSMNLSKTVRADGLTFSQMMFGGDLVLNVSPTGAISKK